MSYLHLYPPSVHCLVSPVCGKRACELNARKRIAEVMGEEMRDASGVGLSETMLCKTCFKADGVQKCGGCGIVAYCGREC